MSAQKVKHIIHIVIYIIIALIFIIHFLSYNVKADPIGLRLEKITVEDYIIISGFNYGGMYNYRSYTTKYSEGVLCIKFSGGFDMPWLEGRNSPSFCPIFNKHKEDLTKIYLSSGSDWERRLVWTKEDGEILK